MDIRSQGTRSTGALPPRDRFFGILARVGTEMPGRVLAAAAMLVAVSAALIPSLGVSTSRYGLVADDDPVQARLVRFFERFGYPDAPLVVVEGGTPQQRRAAVDDLVAAFEDIEALDERVLARVGPREVAEVLLLQRPDLLDGIGSGDGSGPTPAEVIEGGLPAILGALEEGVTAFAVTVQMQSLTPFGPRVSPQRVDEVLRGLGGLARGATASIRGDDMWKEVIGGAAGDEWAGLDDRGYLAGEDGTFHLIALFPDLPSDEVGELRPLVERLRALRDQVMAGHPGLMARITGVPTLAVDEMDVLRRGIRVSTIATSIGILTLFLVAFRSLRQAALAGAPLLVSIVASMALARVLFGELNLVTSSSISVLMGLGIDFSVHTLIRYNEMLRTGDPPKGAIQRAIVRTGPAVMTGAVTTALAFLTTVITDFTAFSEMGVLTALGLVISLMATLLVIPPLIVSSRLLQAQAAPEVPGLRYLPNVVRGAPRVWLIGGMALTLASALLLPRLAFNARYFDFLPEHTESAQALRRLEFDRGMSPLFASLSAESMEEVRAMAARLRDMPEIASVQSPSDLVPPLDDGLQDRLQVFARTPIPSFEKLAAHPATADAVLPALAGLRAAAARIGLSLQLTGGATDLAEAAVGALDELMEEIRALPDGGAAALGRIQQQVAFVAERGWRTAREVALRGSYLPSDLPEIMQVRFASLDRQRLALFAFPSGNVWDHDFAERFVAAVEAVDPEATGFVITTHHHMNIILRGFEVAAGLAGVLVLLMLLWDFRRLSDALLACMPLAMGWLWMLGAMSLFDLTFNVANIVALPLVLGIGIDAGVHVVHRTRESANENGGVGRLQDLIRGTGGAVFLSAATTIAGFAGLMFSDYGAMYSLGLVMVIGVSTCALASLVVLPAALVLLRRVA